MTTATAVVTSVLTHTALLFAMLKAKTKNRFVGFDRSTYFQQTNKLKIMSKRIYIEKIVPENCPLGYEDCVVCGCFELAHDEIICHAETEED